MPAQLLEGLLSEPDGIAASALLALGLRLSPAGVAHDRAGWEALAADEAFVRDTSIVGTEHLLLALLSSLPGDWRALRAQLLQCQHALSPGGVWEAAETYPFSSLAPCAAEHPVITPLVAAEPAVGVSVASTNGEAACYGWADVARERPVEPTTPFRICSISKIATALLLLRLQETGLVALDDPATTYLRAFPLLDPEGEPSAVTLRELLTHTAGMPPGVGLRHYLGPVPAPAESFAEGIRAVRPAGSFAYSNLGFVALGQVAADVLGRSYAEAVTSWVLEPLGLSDVAVAPVLPDDAARGYVVDAGQLVLVRSSAILAQGAGELVCSASSAARLAAAVMTDELISARSREDLLGRYVVQPSGRWQGLAVRVEDRDGMLVAYHGGNWPGYTAAVYAADDGHAVAALANTNVSLLKGFLHAAFVGS
ncbi:serine hydrolase domain-containing protein [Tenggerimyces flavus]|uniref:Serine hydrolase domain-containing protein n=1 Tax=Tenggerimyces flavus TaxID=1708749 RepID=A0ABV7Y2E6_9ACTN|nr:serine hydrolase domain-containing protein [Tenggerimyces flavus]MBM7790728.1 CubicO group peptidase (beta-lactamase class C family) [Tenggerimyces flavus]